MSERLTKTQLKQWDRAVRQSRPESRGYILVAERLLLAVDGELRLLREELAEAQRWQNQKDDYGNWTPCRGGTGTPDEPSGDVPDLFGDYPAATTLARRRPGEEAT